MEKLSMPSKDCSCLLVHPCVMVNVWTTVLMRVNLSRGRLACMARVSSMTPEKVMSCAGPSTFFSAIGTSRLLKTSLKLFRSFGGLLGE